MILDVPAANTYHAAKIRPLPPIRIQLTSTHKRCLASLLFRLPTLPARHDTLLVNVLAVTIGTQVSNDRIFTVFGL